MPVKKTFLEWGAEIFAGDSAKEVLPFPLRRQCERRWLPAGMGVIANERAGGTSNWDRVILSGTDRGESRTRGFYARAE